MHFLEQAFVIDSLFVFSGGVLSGSLAIATDAAHLLTDFAAFMISLFAIWVGQREPTRQMLFGWHRAEVIGALTSVLTIWLVTGEFMLFHVILFFRGLML